MPPGVSLERSQAMGRPGYWDLQCGLSESGHCEENAEPRSMRQDTSGPLSVSTTSSVSIIRGRTSRSKSTGMGTRARADVQSPTLSFISLLEDAMNTSRVQPGNSAQGELSLRGDSLPPVSYFSLLQAQLGDARVEGRVTSCKTAVAKLSNVEACSKSADVKGGFMALLNETTRSLSPVAQRPCPPSSVHCPITFSQAFAEDDSRGADIVSERDSDDSLRPTASAEGDVPRAKSSQRPCPPSVAHCPIKLLQAFAEDESRSADRDIGDLPGATVEGCEGDFPRAECAQRPRSPSVDSGAHCPDNLLQTSAEDESRSADRDSDDLLGATASAAVVGDVSREECAQWPSSPSVGSGAHCPDNLLQASAEDKSWSAHRDSNDLLGAAMVERSEGDVPLADFAQRLSSPLNASVAHCPKHLLQASAEDELRSAASVSERDSDDSPAIAVVEGSESDVEVEKRSLLVANSMCSDGNELGDKFLAEGGGLLTARSMDTLSDILERATYHSSPVLTRIKEDVFLVDAMALPNETSRFPAPDAQQPSSPSFNSGAHCPNHLSLAFAEDESRSAERDINDSLRATASAAVEGCEDDVPRAEFAQLPPSVDMGARCPLELLQAFADDESRSTDRDIGDSPGATTSAAVEGCEGDGPRAGCAQLPSSSSVDSGAHCPDNLLQASAEDESRSAETDSDDLLGATTLAAAIGYEGDVPRTEDPVDQRVADSKCSDENASVDHFPEGAAHESRSADTLSEAIDILETSSPVLTRIKEDVPQADVMLADSAFIVDEIMDALLFEELLRGLGMDQNYASDTDSPSLLEEEVTVADEVVDFERIQSPLQQPLETEHLPNGEPTKEMGDAGSAILEWACEGGLMVMMDANGSMVAEKSCEVQRCYVLDSVFEIYELSTPDIVDTEEPQIAKKRKDDSHLPAELKKHRISYQNSTPQRLHPPECCTKLQSKILRRD